MRVPVDVIGKIIGPKGRKIQGLIEQYQLEALDVEDDGFLQLSSTSMERNEAARKAISTSLFHPLLSLLLSYL